jgi:2-polyprenyl-3-methyl-5-hydroxy-6-metoxy-1,4-benzoquinol methylase
MDLSYVNDAHIMAVGRVPARSKVLDLGAADGSVAETLGQMGCQVWGVEFDPSAAAIAEAHCEEVVVADLNDLDFSGCFPDQRFDVVLMLDILEHLADPAKVLSRVADVLAPGGWGVISLPNVAHISLRLELMAGRFTYRDVGLLDRTHLRFFDRDGVDDLLDAAGWSHFEVDRVVRRLGTTEVELDSPPPELVQLIEEDPEAYTYQFVVCAAPAGSEVLSRPPTLPAAVAQRKALEAELFVHHLQSQLDGTLGRTGDPAVLVEKLEAIKHSSIDRRRQLSDLLVALAEDSERLKSSLTL